MWLIMNGHYRLPFFVLVACLVGIPLIIRKLPPVTTDRQAIRSNQVRAASSVRRLGWIYVGGLVLGTLNILSGGLKEAPWWAAVLGIGWSAFLIWTCFWTAKRYKNSSAEESPKPENKTGTQSLSQHRH
jgi:protein-S-isoprenylcysteine O-methyltransferase Ste14